MKTDQVPGCSRNSKSGLEGPAVAASVAHITHVRYAQYSNSLCNSVHVWGPLQSGDAKGRGCLDHRCHAGLNKLRKIVKWELASTWTCCHTDAVRELHPSNAMYMESPSKAPSGTTSEEKNRGTRKSRRGCPKNLGTCATAARRKMCQRENSHAQIDTSTYVLKTHEKKVPILSAKSG